MKYIISSKAIKEFINLRSELALAKEHRSYAEGKIRIATDNSAIEYWNKTLNEYNNDEASIRAKLSDMRSKIEKPLSEAQKHCTARTVDVGTLIDLLVSAESSLRKVSNVNHAIGTEVEIDPNAQNFPNAYTNHWTPDSTHIFATYTCDGFAITKICRMPCITHRFTWKFTAETVFYFERKLQNMEF